MPVRQFEHRDFIGALILCPHCNQKLTCTAVVSQGTAFNPEVNGLDGYFILQLSDGECCRMFFDRKGIVEPDLPADQSPPATIPS